MGDKLAALAFALALVLGGYAYGVVTVGYEVFPYTHVRNAILGAQAVVRSLKAQSGTISENYWTTAPEGLGGVTIHDPALAFDGMTLYGSSETLGADLVAMDGQVQHSWRPTYDDVWPTGVALPYPRPASIDQAICRKPHVFADGSLLCVLHLKDGFTPYGGGVIKMDRDGKIIWRWFGHAHHDLMVRPDDGAIVTLSQFLATKADPRFASIMPPSLIDELVVLSADGQMQQTISLFDAVADTSFRWVLYPQWRHTNLDPMHANSVHIISAAEAAMIAGVEAGQILISLRNPSTLVVIDLETEKVVWAKRGDWHHQHDAGFTAAGGLVMFDNQGPVLGAGIKGSRMLHLDADSAQPILIYDGLTDGQQAGAWPLYSDVKSAAQLLPNGNVLITESMRGRLLEVTPQGAVAWEYINPVRHDDNGALVPTVQQGFRYSRDELPFLAD